MKKFFKEEGKLGKEKHSGAKLTITTDGKPDVVQLEELQKQASLQRKVSNAKGPLLTTDLTVAFLRSFPTPWGGLPTSKELQYF